MRARFGGGIQHQAPNLDQAIYNSTQARHVPERAQTVEAGLEQRLGSAWRLAASVYHRHDDDRLRFQDTEVRVVGNFVVTPSIPHWTNALTGDSKGVEITLVRKSVNGLNGWLSYAWSDSRLEGVAIGNPVPEQFAADFDQRHTVNAYVSYRWSGRTSLSARMRYGSNFPITGYINQVADGYTLSDQRNTTRLPAYSRLDLRADRTFTYRKSRLTLFLEVVNAMNRDNFRPNSPFYNLNTRRVFEPTEELFPLLPVAGILIEF